MKNWVIQDNIITDINGQAAEVATAVRSLGGKIYPVSLKFFCDDMEFWETLDTKNVMVYGSCKLTTLALKEQWTGVFFNDNFNAKVWNANRNDMLNQDCIIIRVDETATAFESVADDELRFIRPIHDLKEFAGTVTTVSEIKKWMSSTDSGNYSFGPDTLVSIAPVQEILGEWRWFVVDGKVIDGSAYRMNGKRYRYHETDQSVIDEAQTFADKWLPHKNCVMDLALTHNGVKVIEFNCLNSSGFYAHDVAKIVKAIIDLPE